MMRFLPTGFLRASALVILLGAGQARADEALRHIQQSLRDQGFYYGPINGTPGDETTQALRRYQIRNGLGVTGQLNDETRRSIERAGAASGGQADASTPPPLATPTPASVDREDPAPAYRAAPIRPGATDDVPRTPVTRVPGNIRPDLRARPVAPYAGSSGEPVPPDGVAPSASLTTLFASTPYEFAPPPVQADVLRRAQTLLSRGGFYDGRANGVTGPATSDALANYQEVNRLRRTGRLDVSTLGTMRLLPGRQRVDPRRDIDPRQPGPNIIFQGRVVD